MDANKLMTLKGFLDLTLPLRTAANWQEPQIQHLAGFAVFGPWGIKKSIAMFTRCPSAEAAPPGAEINPQREQER